jgi:NTE family protein
MTDSGRRKRVAIACQGGGSHTAFTAGVLAELFDSAEMDSYEVVGLSGTSGGAVCALLTWRALIDGGPERVGPALRRFWADNSASTPWQRLLNSMVIGASALQSVGAAPAVSPYDSPVATLDQFRVLLESQLDFDKIEVDRLGQWPMLLVGAVDVLSGDFRAFNSRRDRITSDVVLASAAIPSLFPAVHAEGGTYWDGLFSQNPPVRELTETEPDEIWVIQINPKERESEPRSVVEIVDRRNELAGNLSLYQELHFIEEINRLLDAGLLAPGGRYKHVVVRVIELSRSRSSALLGPASKLNREAKFIDALIAEGEQQATEFLTALAFEAAWSRRDADAVVGFFADDAVARSDAPFPERGTAGGPAELRAFLQAHFDSGVCMDLNRKQVSRDRVIWTARGVLGGAGDDLVWGRCEVLFRDGTAVELNLGAVG